MSNDEKKIVQGGSTANKHGKILEKALIPAFQENGYRILKPRDKDFDSVVELVDKYVISNAEYISIYGRKCKTEFVLVNKNTNSRIRIECKWQQSSGSVDEKLPYLFLNCVESFEEKDIIIIIDGEGQRKGAIEWLKNAASNPQLNKGKNISVMNLSEFMKWLNDSEKR